MQFEITRVKGEKQILVILNTFNHLLRGIEGLSKGR